MRMSKTVEGTTTVLAALALLTAALIPACARAGRGDGLYAEVATNRGLIVLKLEFERTPMTAANFVGLAEGTIDNAAFPAGRPYFDGTKWHRVVPGHVIQCGVAAGGLTGGPGYEFPNEIALPDLNHGRAGMVNMANGGPHTNGSQWCITLGDRSYLDGDYTVFGSVVEGMGVVAAIAQGDEVRTVKIVRVGGPARAFRPTTASFMALVAEAKARVAEADAARRAKEDALIRTNWPDAVDTGSGLKHVILKPGTGRRPTAGERVWLAYSGTAPLAGRSFVSTSALGSPYWGDTPEPFELTVGTPAVNPGLDAAVADMSLGERRLVVVPSALGYKESGFYAKERPGEKRFVISPNTLLVYEVEIRAIAAPLR